MAKTIHDISLLLGKVEAQIIALSENAQRADKARQITSEKLDHISTHIYTAEQHIKDLESRLGAVEKPMMQIHRWQERGIGAIICICLSSVFIGEAAKSFVTKLLTFIHF